MADAAEFAARMVQALAVADPDLDTQIGSVPRKIIDAVAEQMAEVTIDSQLLNATFDIDSKLGSDLDDFCRMFGYTRLPAHRATGVVTFHAAPAPADSDIFIPVGTQVATGTYPEVIFNTAATAYIRKGASSVDVPIQAVLAGEAGNLPAGSITVVLTGAGGDLSGTVTQASATTGGVSEESDAALAERFKKTLFRSSAGTRDMYLALALEAGSEVGSSDRVVTRAIVLGASEVWRERVQVGSNGTAQATIPSQDHKYVFPGSIVVGEDIARGSILTPEVHYAFDHTAAVPAIQILGNSVPTGTFLDIEFEYSPAASRNDPKSGITNRVDLYCDGEVTTEVTEVTAFTATTPFVAGNETAHSVERFLRSSGGTPTVGNYFIRLSYGPITSFPSALVVGGRTYYLGVDYWLVAESGANANSPSSVFGLEWKADAPNQPDEHAAISLSGSSTYTFNRMPAIVEDRIRRWGLVSTDARAHAANRMYFDISMAMVIDPNYSQDQISSAVDVELTRFFNSLAFGQRVETSDLIHVVHGIPGVDNVRLLKDTEAIDSRHHSVQYALTPTGNVVSSTQNDVPLLGLTYIAVLRDVFISYRAANSFNITTGV